MVERPDIGADGMEKRHRVASGANQNGGTGRDEDGGRNIGLRTDRPVQAIVAHIADYTDDLIRLVNVRRDEQEAGNLR